LLPIIQSRTKQQAKETGESLVTGAESVKNVTKNSGNSGSNYRSNFSRERKKKIRKSSRAN
jgi:hypothetical protein